jgi:hypothetical protein
MIPGDPERRRRARFAEGLPLETGLLAALRQAGETLGVETPGFAA